MPKNEYFLQKLPFTNNNFSSFKKTNAISPKKKLPKPPPAQSTHSKNFPTTRPPLEVERQVRGSPQRFRMSQHTCFVPSQNVFSYPSVCARSWRRATHVSLACSPPSTLTKLVPPRPYWPRLYSRKTQKCVFPLSIHLRFASTQAKKISHRFLYFYLIPLSFFLPCWSVHIVIPKLEMIGLHLFVGYNISLIQFGTRIL